MVLIIWIGLMGIVGIVAKDYKRRLFPYLVLGFFLSPIIALIVLLIKGEATEQEYIRSFSHIFYCPECRYAYAERGKGPVECPRCKIQTIETTVLEKDWIEKTPEEQEELRNAFSRGEYKLVQQSNEKEH